MKYIANLCKTYGHNMLLLLLSVLFPSQLYVLMPPHPPTRRYDIRIQADTKPDRHLLHAVHFDRGGLQLAFHHRYT